MHTYLPPLPCTHTCNNNNNNNTHTATTHPYFSNSWPIPALTGRVPAKLYSVQRGEQEHLDDSSRPYSTHKCTDEKGCLSASARPRNNT